MKLKLLALAALLPVAGMAQTSFTTAGGILVGGTQIGTWSVVNTSGADWGNFVSTAWGPADEAIRLGGSSTVAGTTQPLALEVVYNLTQGFLIPGTQFWGNYQTTDSPGTVIGPSLDQNILLTGPTGTVAAGTSTLFNEAAGTVTSTITAPETLSNQTEFYQVDTAGALLSYPVSFEFPDGVGNGPQGERWVIGAEFAIPEPSTALLGGLLGLGMLIRRKR